MKSSADAPRGQAQDKVMLPTFQQMMEHLPELAEQPEELMSPSDAMPLPKRDLAKEELEQAKQLAANMRREALTEAEKIVNGATQEAVAIRDKARRETENALHAQYEIESRAAKDSMFHAVAALSKAEDQLYDAIEPHLLDISIHICESILQYELSRDDTAYLSIVRNALSLLSRDNKERTLRLPPGGFALLIGDDDTPFAQQLQDMGVTVVIDKNLAEGDCMVESPLGGLRAGAVTQLSRIRYAASPQKEE